jgi:hypothetical protein
MPGGRTARRFARWRRGEGAVVESISVDASAPGAIESNPIMAMLSVSEQLKLRVEAQADAEGFYDVEEYLLWLVAGPDYSAPPERTIYSDEQLEALLLERIDGPSVPMDAAEFAQMRAKFQKELERTK